MANEQLEPIERAWRYLDAASNYQHSRVQAFLIAHAFLVGAYAQLYAASAKNAGHYLLLGLIAFMGFVVGALFAIATGGLEKKIHHLTERWLIQDCVYKDYQGLEVNGLLSPKLYNRIISSLIPQSFVIFWMLLAVYALISACHSW